MAGVGYGDILVHAKSIEPWAGSADRMFAEAGRIGFVYGLLLTFVCISIMRERVLIGASWVASLGILYYLWPTHLVEYLTDFIPAIVIAGAVAVASLRRLAIWQRYILAIIFVSVSIASLYSVYIRPWTGMFDREAVYEAAQYFKEHVPLAEPVFTAAVIVPYLSGHHVPFNLSHPQWYGYSFISEGDKKVFLPSYDQVRKAAEVSEWALREQLTDYVYPGINFKAFLEVHSISNDTRYRQNPFRFYKRL